MQCGRRVLQISSPVSSFTVLLLRSCECVGVSCNMGTDHRTVTRCSDDPVCTFARTFSGLFSCPISSKDSLAFSDLGYEAGRRQVSQGSHNRRWLSHSDSRTFLAALNGSPPKS